MTPDYAVELLGEQHDRASFSCGVAPLDHYLQRQAGQDQRRYLAAVYVLIDIATSAIAGYYTICGAAIDAADLPESITKRLARYPVLPATLIGRLAVDLRFKGKGFGGVLLHDALRRSLRSEVASMAVVVDAKDDAARTFYEHFGFVGFQDQQRRLYIPMATIQRFIG